MATNIEIKARVEEPESLKRLVEDVSDKFDGAIDQEDIFFDIPAGRLKLRILAQDQAQLIYYERPDASGPKISDYFISETAEPGKLQVVLTKALGIRGVVRKRRLLYWIGQTRIHLDRVENLGDFMELEVVMRPEQPAEEGSIIAAEIMEKLGIAEADLIEGAYIDLIESES